ncbi:hypothetical protein EH165_03270 [Nakamurella antarctica]|uniref:DUF3558 domain-containing protein n=1 Tax=Nakamurella antarctica TaxID=1902245 RepID=A0A3G8ZKE6_9ACTN|nr:hypothetical protein [Nakamurella antarctica]AZI57325.1 hypothetical protein EH165_03270 [Nakamurella antarctica]
MTQLPRRHSPARGRIALTAFCTAVILAASACSSDSPGSATAAPGASAASPAAASAAPADPTVDSAQPGAPDAAPAQTVQVPDAGSADSGGSGTVVDTTGLCGLITPAEVSAVTGEYVFLNATDIGSEEMPHCIYGAGANLSAISIAAEPAQGYLGGEVATASPKEAVATFISAQELTVGDPMSKEILVGSIPAAQTTGHSITTAPNASISFLSGATVIVVTFDGQGLNVDPASLAGPAIAVAGVAAAKVG